MATAKPALKLITGDAPYRDDPAALFNQLCGARPATLLLESADVDSKNNLQSLLITDSALRITAFGDTVTVQALSENGASLLPLLDAALPEDVEIGVRPDGRELRFPPIDPLQDEDSRLKSVSVLDALRLIPTLVHSDPRHREAVMLCGLFHYYLVAEFETMPQLATEKRSPD